MENWYAVENHTEATMDEKWISNMKTKTKKEMEPVGHDFEAVLIFKEYCDKKDNFFVYKMNDRRGNPDLSSFIFKTGK